MRVVDLIAKKRDGLNLSEQEIEFLVEGITTRAIPDYQVAALCMAIFFQGMDREEISNLTLKMAHSGEIVDLSGIQGKKIDKHSTGGVGDKTTLVVTPLVASCGVKVAKMSGRGLGHTGGTIDKLESIPGFNVNLKKEEFIQQVNKIGLSVIAQTNELAPADKYLYSLRDVTATVDSIPLIASSIMSKKIASGADNFVLDVKTGNGAFMATVEEAFELARTLVGIGKTVGKETIAYITDMNQPLGRLVGNSLEVQEAILTLNGEGPEDLVELSVQLGSSMLVIAGCSANESEARKLLESKLRSKKALQKFAEMIEIQGGDRRVVDNLDLLPQAKYKYDVKIAREGYVTEIDTKEIGLSAMKLGAGRGSKDEKIDLAVGLEMRKKIGDFVRADERIAVIYSNSQDVISGVAEKIRGAYKLSSVKPAYHDLIYGKVTSKDLE